MIQYNKEEKIFLQNLKDKLVGTCKTCNGRGVIGEFEFEICQCKKVFNYIYALKIFGIPKSYWFLDIKEFEFYKDHASLLNDYLKKHQFARGQGFTFYGESGTGKTFLSSVLGMAVACERFYVRYFTLQQLLDDLYSYDTILMKRIRQSDFLICDDFNWKMLEENKLKYKVDDAFKSIIQENKSIIFCTRDTVDRDHYLSNLISHKNKSILLDEKVEKKIVVDENYYCDCLLFMADLFFQKEEIALNRNKIERYS